MKNRSDYNGDYLSGAIVEISDQYCGSLPNPTQMGVMYDILCDSPLEGDTLKIKLVGDDKIIHMDDV